ncbi:putative HVA22-like protein g [Pyrus x bretschneideri]|uniref:putative HVA22-like protein g n=1 Tax=Pyrus x bretschneideri TaxID=225117 RepID=UPI00202F5005|nr:putative HVA22-like protein g [Pyrus x bretschneideri]
MIGSFLTRTLVMALGYAYPAYECYKTVEKNKPEIEQLRFWCQYWILVAVLTVCERVGDAFVSWVPMYSEAKLLFIIYLWFPKTKGTTYVYDSFFRPYLAKHENEIDRNLLELKTRAGDMAIVYWQRAASYGQTRIFDILQYVAAQSTPRPRPAQPQQGVRRQPTTPPPNRQPAATTQSQPEEPPSPTSSTSSSKDQKEIVEALAPSPKPKPAPQTAGSITQKATATAAASESSSQTTPTEEAAPTQTDAAPSSSATEETNPPPKETVMEETIRVTRGKLRKARSAGNR